MPSFSIVQASSSNSAFSPTYLPMAVFAFARYTKGNAHIILIGRNRAAAESILASFPNPSTDSDWKHEFVACDASLMKNIGSAAEELLPRINFLVISSGYASLLGRNETEEGIDHQLAMGYYGRWKFISDLLPALRAANGLGEPSKVMAVLDPLSSCPVDSTDFGLKFKYSGMTALRASCTYIDMALEEFAIRDPEIAFTRIMPGFLAAPLIKPMIWAFAKSPDVCAEYMLFSLLSGEKGFMRRGEKGDDLGKKHYFGTEDARKKLWDHTLKAVDVGTGKQ
ncbi:hypothetical protein DFH07DRAFT_872045 [Mycena maculata]|uniref:NAD(P)-binding protein n=1 Tax=Mycena maculata TaxID=230809 RepID=A0AAD7ML84_9AGAR|nr:hypothetical protein DFH07DRAFT_872045 [Mycena maculata]